MLVHGLSIASLQICVLVLVSQAQAGSQRVPRPVLCLIMGGQALKGPRLAMRQPSAASLGDSLAVQGDAVVHGQRRSGEGRSQTRHIIPAVNATIHSRHHLACKVQGCTQYQSLLHCMRARAGLQDYNCDH